MSILRDFEKRLEGAVEGIFARMFRSGLQPVELAKAVQRYQADYQHVGVDSVVVPNVYRFTLSPSDLERFSGFTRSLQRELADVARRTANERGWSTQGPIRIEFERDETVRVGTFELRGKSEAPGDVSNAPRPAPTHQPPAPQSHQPSQPHQPSPTPGAQPVLRAIDGADSGKSFTVDGGTAVIGRLPECDVTLTSAGVSRRHARLERTANGGWTLTDLGSTNGVRINNQPVSTGDLRPGDRFEIGDVSFTFLVSG